MPKRPEILIAMLALLIAAGAMLALWHEGSAHPELYRPPAALGARG